MLVTFTSSTSGQIMMFAQVARQLLELVGKDCSARGVITTEQLPEAIERLRVASVEHTSHSTNHSEADNEDGSDEQDPSPIGFGQRAYPMIELLEWTRKEDGFVLWEAAKDF